jgi:hypothetical protein
MQVLYFVIYCKNDIPNRFLLFYFGVHGGVEGTGMDIFEDGEDGEVGIQK